MYGLCTRRNTSRILSVEPKDILWDINDGQVYDLRSKFKFNYYPMNASCASSTMLPEMVIEDEDIIIM